MTITNVEPPWDWVRRGLNATVRVSAYNAGETAVTRTLTVAVDGEAVASESVTLGSEERVEVPIEFRATEGTVTVEDVRVGYLDVGDRQPTPSDADAGDTESSTDDSSEADLLARLADLLSVGLLVLVGTVTLGGIVLGVRWR